MNVDFNQKPTSYLKSSGGDSKMMSKKNNLKAVFALLGFLVFIGGAISVFLISQKQNTTPIAPNVPQSKPAAYIEKPSTCTLIFDVAEPNKLACGEQGCTQDSDCSNDLICVTAEDGDKYCAQEDYEEACADNPSAESCCSAPEEELLVCGAKDCTKDSDCEDGLVCITADNDNKYCAKGAYEEACADNPTTANCCTAPEDEPLSCGEPGCSNTDDCKDGFVCISTSKTDSSGNIVKYCADEDYLDECVANPNTKNCCEAPVTTTVTTTTTVTATTTVTPTGTVTPSVTTVITTVGCNDTCTENADCSNISHICYNGQCRLDVNPTDSQCKLPSGETTIVRPIRVPTESGPAEWMNYVKAGLGVLGVGALLLLLL